MCSPSVHPRATPSATSPTSGDSRSATSWWRETRATIWRCSRATRWVSSSATTAPSSNRCVTLRTSTSQRAAAPQAFSRDLNTTASKGLLGNRSERGLHPPTAGCDVRVAASEIEAVSYTHLRAHETDSYLVCRLLLEKKKRKI